MSEPALDFSEIISLYKVDARRAVDQMRAAVEKWSEVAQGGAARLELRRLAHQLRGSGSTYGFREVSRIGKALEHILIKLQDRRVVADERLRGLVTSLVERLAAAFK
jgi:chemotaxis protein histidine kinase CheA